MFCHVGPKQVIGVHDVASTYHVPLLLEEQKVCDYFIERLKLNEVYVASRFKTRGLDLWSRWRTLTETNERLLHSVSIVLVGKYTGLQDSYVSVVKSLEHASMKCGRKLQLEWVDAADLENETYLNTPVRYHKAWHLVCSANGILVPGGFGTRGIEGMIAAAKWARENKVPYLGICLGYRLQSWNLRDMSVVSKVRG